MDYKKWLKRAVITASLACAPAFALVTGTNLTVTTSVEAADTSSLSIGFVNGILYSFVGQTDTIGKLMVLLMVLGLISAVFGAITGLFAGIAGLSRGMSH